MRVIDDNNETLGPPVKIGIWIQQRWMRLTALLLAALIVPYAFSRIASPGRLVSVHTTSKAGTNTRSSEKQIRIACYNIAHGRGVAETNWDGGGRVERLARLDEIAKVLRRINADVVVLNEVDFDSSWSFSVNQARYLAAQAGYPHWAEQRNLDLRILFWKWRFGNAVLSKYPITDAYVADLPSYALWETVLAGKKRGLICDVNFGHQSLKVIGAHLSHRSERLRVSSAVVLADIASNSALPTIVAGDLNSTPTNFPLSTTDSEGRNAIETLDISGCFRRSPIRPPAADNQFTFHSAKPRSVIDWVMIPANWDFLVYRIDDSRLSDHRLVYADIAPPPDE